MTGKNLVKKIAFGTAVIASLLGGVNAYAQSKPTDESMYKRTGDFMLVSDYLHPLDKDNTTSIDSILRGGNVTSYSAIDAIEGLKGRLKYLKSEEGKKKFTPEQRDNLTLRYLGFIQDIKKEKRNSNYAHSLESLSSACEDGYIFPSEIRVVDDGTYMIVKEGTDKKEGKYSIYALVELKNKSIVEEPKEKPLPSSNSNEEVSGYPHNERVADKDKVKEYKDAEEKWRSQYPVNERVLDRPDYVQETFPEPKEKVNPVWSWIAGANANKDFDYFNGSYGRRVNPFQNENIGLGLVGNLGIGKDKEIDSQRIPLSRGKEFVGEINEIDNYSLGLSAELQLYNLIVGGGFDYSKHISETNEKVIRGEEVLDSSTISVPENKIVWKGYIGAELEIPKTNGWRAGATVGYNSNKQVDLGLRVVKKLNKRK